MRTWTGLIFALALGASALLGCSDSAESVDPIEGFDPLEGIGTVELVADGFIFTEGPTWRAAEQRLLFTDIPASTIYALTPPDDVTPINQDSGDANGLDSDVNGLLLAAEHANRRVSRTLEDGTTVTVASEYMGDSLNSPNDIAVRSDGTIYFTDPPYGINASVEQELDFNGVFRVAPNGALTAEWEGELSSRPNGLVLSPRERFLYVANTVEAVMVFDVAADGSLGNERPFVDPLPSADGMAMDTGGNLYVATATGVQVFDPEGNLWGTIEVPDNRVPANCAFGGEDARTLYITARAGLYQVRLMRPGLY
ncbi:MAG: SMP-30/gluconolactonase/LRE family protein [Polyangiales bacterium]